MKVTSSNPSSPTPSRPTTPPPKPKTASNDHSPNDIRNHPCNSAKAQHVPIHPTAVEQPKIHFLDPAPVTMSEISKAKNAKIAMYYTQFKKSFLQEFIAKKELFINNFRKKSIQERNAALKKLIESNLLKNLQKNNLTEEQIKSHKETSLYKETMREIYDTLLTQL
jgi:hypothetical protein